MRAAAGSRSTAALEDDALVQLALNTRQRADKRGRIGVCIGDWREARRRQSSDRQTRCRAARRHERPQYRSSRRCRIIGGVVVVDVYGRFQSLKV